MSQLKDDLRQYIVNNFLFGKSDPAFTDGASLLEHGLIDSTGILEIVAHLEAAYGVRVGDEEMVPDNLDSVDNLAAFVTRKSARPAPEGAGA